MKLSQLSGIGEGTEKKLADKGIVDVSQLMVYSPAKVSEMLSITNDDVHKLFRKARDALEKQSIIGKMFQTGLEKYESDKIRDQISCGSRSLDKLFGGGVEVGETTEVFGEYGCGKSQFCHMMVVRSQLPHWYCNKCMNDFPNDEQEKCDCGGDIVKGGLATKENPDPKTIWIDTEKTFIPDRIKSIAKHIGLDPQRVLKNIIVAEAMNSVDQQIILESVSELLTEDKDIKIIVIDSAMGLFRSDYTGRDNLSERQKFLGRFLALASNIASFYGLTMIWTNQVMISPGVFYGDPIQAIGGTIMAHKSTHRVYFKKSGQKRIGKMVDSPRYAQTEVTFGLMESGLVDPEVIDEEIKKKKSELAKAARKSKKSTENEEENNE